MFKYFFAAVFFFLLIGIIANAQEKSKRKKRNSNRYKLEKKKAWTEEDKAKFGHLDTAIEKKRLALLERVKEVEEIEKSQIGRDIPKHSKDWSEARRAVLEQQLAQQEYEKLSPNDEWMKEFLTGEAKREKARIRKEKDTLKREEARLKKEAEENAKYNEAKSLLEQKGLHPLSPPIDKTGDKRRYLDFREECANKELTNKYLYLVRIKSNIDDKKLIKIGITSNENIDERFEDDDVIELIEVIKCVKLETRVAMALEYFLIQKYRPKDYLAEDEFDAFSRFGGYTEVIPMRYTKDVSKDIDAVLEDSEKISEAFNNIRNLL